MNCRFWILQDTKVDRQRREGKKKIEGFRIKFGLLIAYTLQLIKVGN